MRFVSPFITILVSILFLLESLSFAETDQKHSSSASPIYLQKTLVGTATVSITTHFAHKDISGSGFIVGKTSHLPTLYIIVTARHLSVNLTTQVSFGDGSIGRILSLSQHNKNTDILFLLVASSHTYPYLQLASKDAWIGQDLVSITRPKPNIWRKRFLTLYLPYEAKDGIDEAFICDTCQEGDSGSGIVDTSGHVYGMLISLGPYVGNIESQESGKTTLPATLVFTIPVSVIHSELRQVRWSHAPKTSG
jgi:Trypsin-like peptidase domain